MSQENVEIVLESIRRFRPSGLDEWAELWHPDTRMTLPEGFPEPGPFIGLDAVKREFERVIDSFSVLRFEDVEVVADWGTGLWPPTGSLLAVRRAGSKPMSTSLSPIELKTAS